MLRATKESEIEDLVSEREGRKITKVCMFLKPKKKKSQHL